MQSTACNLDPADAPIMRLSREWQDITARANGSEPMTDEEITDATRRRYEIKDQMLALPCTTPQDFIAKIMASTTWGMSGIEDDGAPSLWSEAGRFLT